MRSLLLFSLLLLWVSNLLAEGLASTTTVTRANATSLDFHRLDVIRRSQNGKSFIAIEVRPAAAHPFSSCSVTVYDKNGDKILLQFDPTVGRTPKRKDLPEGFRAIFHVADELVDEVQIRYHLHANEFQSHVFTIPRGQVGKIANLR